jgi:hypothetical protein
MSKKGLRTDTLVTSRDSTVLCRSRLEKPTIRAQILLKADQVSLMVKAEPGGKLRLTCAPWEDARVILLDQTLELRAVGGQIHIGRTHN